MHNWIIYLIFVMIFCIVFNISAQIVDIVGQILEYRSAIYLH